MLLVAAVLLMSPSRAQTMSRSLISRSLPQLETRDLRINLMQWTTFSTRLIAVVCL